MTYFAKDIGKVTVNCCKIKPVNLNFRKTNRLPIKFTLIDLKNVADTLTNVLSQPNFHTQNPLKTNNNEQFFLPRG